MKPFISKIWMPLLVLGAALALAPQSRAQSEVAPDHFDGTDSWAAATTSKTAAPKVKQSAAPSLSARNTKPTSPAMVSAASAKNTPQSQGPKVVAVQDKRKTTPHKPNNQ